jgi:DNA invertase Pin-like site-specific DNA recombinase
MLAALRDGQINAVVVWDLDRLTRRPVEIEEFIELADKHDVQLASVGGDVDLSTDNGRLYARIKGAVARAEIERKAARQKAANEQRRSLGKPHAGRRSFGYAADGMSIVDPEADAVQRAAADLIAGSSMYEIAKSLNAAGHTTTAGNPWKPTTARRMLARPRYAALVEHGGEVVAEGVWPPILDVDTHHAIRGILADPERHKAGPPRRYLLSGIATCAVCGLAVLGAWEARKGYSVYRCASRGHISRRVDLIDDFVEAIIVERLVRPDAVDLFAAPDRADRGRELRQQESATRSRLDGLAEAFAAGDIDSSQLRAGSRRLRATLDQVIAELTTIATEPEVTQLLVADDVATAWAELSLDRRRTILRSILTIKLTSPGQGARVFRPDEVAIGWRG